MSRRSLAYDLAGAASLEALEEWTQLLFEKMGGGGTGLLRADRALRVGLSEQTQTMVGQTDPTSGSLIVDDTLRGLANHPEVVSHFLPV